MWMPVSDVPEKRCQRGATCRKRGGRIGAEGGHRKVAVDSAQKTLTASWEPGSSINHPQKRDGSVGLGGPCGEAPPPSKDELYWHKCFELQRYVRPLESILQRLRSGQFSRRLSSVQQGVAIERIQRIMAMLQNPNMGGSFLTNIQKLEGMLKSWFPHVSPTLNQMDNNVLAKRRKRFSSSSSTSCSPQEVTQVNAVSSSTDCLRERGCSMDTPFRPGLRGLPPYTITSPCLERLLQAKQSIVTPPVRGGLNSWDIEAVTENR